MRPALSDQIVTLIAALLFGYGFFGTGYWLFAGGFLFDGIAILIGETSSLMLELDSRRVIGLSVSMAAIFAGPILGSSRRAIGRMTASVALLSIVIFHGARLVSEGLVVWFAKDPPSCAGALGVILIAAVCIVSLWTVPLIIRSESEEPGRYYRVT